MTNNELMTLIAQSTFLSSKERAFWLKNVHTMSPAQIHRLEDILHTPEDIPFEKEIVQYLSLLGEAADEALKANALAPSLAK